MTEASVPFWTLRKKSSRGSQARDEGEENAPMIATPVSHLNGLTNGESNEIHSIASHKMVLN